MANVKISALTGISIIAADDVIPITDISLNTTYKITVKQLQEAAVGSAMSIASLALTTDLAIADGGTGASNAATARTNLGLGTMATQGSNNVAVTGGTISGITNFKVRAWSSIGIANLANSTYQLVPCNGVDYNEGSAYNAGTYIFTATQTGYYYVHGCIGYGDVVADKVYRAAIYKNGAAFAISDKHASLAANLSVDVGSIVQLGVGETIALYAYHSAGVGTVDVATGMTVTYLNIFKLT